MGRRDDATTRRRDDVAAPRCELRATTATMRREARHDHRLLAMRPHDRIAVSRHLLEHILDRVQHDGASGGPELQLRLNAPRLLGSHPASRVRSFRVSKRSFREE